MRRTSARRRNAPVARAPGWPSRATGNPSCKRSAPPQNQALSGHRVQERGTPHLLVAAVRRRRIAIPSPSTERRTEEKRKRRARLVLIDHLAGDEHAYDGSPLSFRPPADCVLRMRAPPVETPSHAAVAVPLHAFLPEGPDATVRHLRQMRILGLQAFGPGPQNLARCHRFSRTPRILIRRCRDEQI